MARPGNVAGVLPAAERRTADMTDADTVFRVHNRRPEERPGIRDFPPAHSPDS